METKSAGTIPAAAEDDKRPFLRPLAAAQEILFFLILAFSPIFYGSVETWSTAVLHISILALLLLWVCEGVFSGELTLRNTPLDTPLVLFLAYAVMNALVSRYWAASRDQLFMVVDFVLMFVLGVKILSRRGTYMNFFIVVTVLGTAISLYGIFKHFFHQEVTGLTGPFVNHNHFAGWLEMCLPLSIALSLFGKRGIKSVRPVFYLSSLIIGLTLLFTVSRGGILSMACALSLVTVLVISQRMFSVRTTGAVIFPLIFLFYAYLAGLDPIVRRFSLRDVGISGAARMSLWEGTIQAFRERPILGNGMGTFPWLYPKYRPPEVMNKVDQAHNEYLQLLAEMGMVGFLLFLVAAWIFCRTFLRVFSERHDEEMKGLALGAFTGVLSLSFHNLVDFNLHVPSNVLLWAGEIGLALVVVNTKKRLGDKCFLRKRTIPLRGRARTLGVALLIPLSVFWAWTLVRPALAYVSSSMGDLGGLIRAVELDRGRAEYHCSIGRAYYRKPAAPIERDDLLREGIKEMEAGLALNPLDANCHCDMGWMLLRLGFHDKAEEELLACVNLDPNNYSYRQIIANYYLMVGQEEKALHEMKRAASINPQGLRTFLQDMASRIADPTALRSMVPETAEGLREFSQFLSSRGRTSEAIGVLEKAVVFFPQDDKNIKSLVAAYRETGEKGKAIAVLKRALSKGHNSGELHRFLGDTYADNGQREDAIAEYEIAMAASPSDPMVYRSLASFYVKLGWKDKAEGVLKEAVEKNLESGTFLLELARFYRGERMWMESLQAAKKAAMKDPRNADIRGFLAALYLEKNMYFEATLELKEILKVTPGNLGVRFQLGDIYESLKLTRKAKAEYEDVLALDPGNQQAKDRIEKLH